MSLILNINACLNNCNKIVINEVTGLYNAINNTGGWNDGSTVWRTNADSPYVEAATLSISLNSGTPVVINVLSTIQAAVFPEFELYEYAPVDNNGYSSLQDGYYNIIYSVTDSDDNTYETETEYFIYCNVACCVSKLAAKVAQELCNDCDSDAYNDFLIADGILQALKAVAESKGTAEFIKLLTKLQKLCNQTTDNCGCGCN
jgi:hypothetical protein